MALSDATLGERELDVMGALWRDGPGTVAEVRERLPASLAYNTVLTILRNLEAKGFARHTAEGRTFRYHPAVAEQDVRGSALSRLVQKLFRGSALRVVADLVEQHPLSSDELRQLHQLLHDRLTGDARARPGRKRGGTAGTTGTAAAPAKRSPKRSPRRRR